ncbi:MAG: type II toxin-antitoxin system RatA family toxin [Gammaproteobacteria bacterium]|nr:type II toxin-antitoxin system RatA family toxin [Gammaproteobacteria bacterium]
MVSIKRSALVPYTAEKMFKLVGDIASYPSFLPWCKDTQIHEDLGDQVRASIEMSKAGIHKSFTTQNLAHGMELIEMSLVDGPFKHLKGFWRFDALSAEACKVSLDIEFEFSNRLLSSTVGPVFQGICNTLVEAFVQRAREVYGH